MSKINRKWILRSLQVLIALSLMLSVVPAGAHLSGGYLHDATIGTSNPNWMGEIPNERRLSALSIPATHDTMALSGG